MKLIAVLVILAIGLVITAAATFVAILGFGAFGLIIGPAVGIGITITLISKAKTEISNERHRQEAHVLQKISAGVPLTEQEKNIHAEMIAKGIRDNNNNEKEGA